MDPESMKILTSLAFKENEDKRNKEDEKNDSIQKIDIESKKKLIDENNVLIGNEIFYKGTQFNIIDVYSRINFKSIWRKISFI